MLRMGIQHFIVSASGIPKRERYTSNSLLP